VDRAQDERRAAFESSGNARQDLLVRFVTARKTKGAFAQADGRVKCICKVELARVCNDELRGQLFSSRFGARDFDQSRRHIDACGRKTTAGKLETVAAGSAADVENSCALCKPHRLNNEIHFADGAAREGPIEILFADEITDGAIERAVEAPSARAAHAASQFWRSSLTSSAASDAGQTPGASRAYHFSSTLFQSRRLRTSINCFFTSADCGWKRLYLIPILRMRRPASCSP